MRILKLFASVTLVLSLAICSVYLYLKGEGEKENSYFPLIKRISKKYKVDPYLVNAIIKRESNFQAKIRGKAGEYGLMQITEGAAKDWTRITKNKLIISEDFFYRPEINIDIGAWYISQALRRWENNPYQKIYALAEYNAGRGNLKKWLKNSNEKGFKVIKIKSTKKYIEYVLSYYNKTKLTR